MAASQYLTQIKENTFEAFKSIAWFTFRLKRMFNKIYILWRNDSHCMTSCNFPCQIQSPYNHDNTIYCHMATHHSQQVRYTFNKSSTESVRAGIFLKKKLIIGKVCHLFSFETNIFIITHWWLIGLSVSAMTGLWTVSGANFYNYVHVHIVKLTWLKTKHSLQLPQVPVPTPGIWAPFIL